MRGSIAVVPPATCGVMRTSGASHSGCPSGSGSGSVTSRAKRSRPGVAQDGGGVDHRAAGDVDDQCAVGQVGQEVVVDEAPGAVGQRHQHHHDVLVGEQLRQVGGGADAAHEVVVALPARHRGDLGLHRQQPLGQGAADRAVAQDQHPRVGQRAPAGHPAPVPVPAHRLRYPAQAGQDEPDRVLGRRVVVHPGGVAEGDAVRQPVGDPVVARALQLHDAQAAQLVAAVDHVGARRIVRHPQVDVTLGRGTLAVPDDDLDALDRADRLGELGGRERRLHGPTRGR